MLINILTQQELLKKFYFGVTHLKLFKHSQSQKKLALVLESKTKFRHPIKRKKIYLFTMLKLYSGN